MVYKIVMKTISPFSKFSPKEICVEISGVAESKVTSEKAFVFKGRVDK